jgi:hypothetical protein
VLGAGYWMLGAGYWILDAGCWMLGAGLKESVVFFQATKTIQTGTILVLLFCIINTTNQLYANEYPLGRYRISLA